MPAETKPPDFFAFLQQQGYLRVWLDGDHRSASMNRVKVKRLPAVVPVIQDRLAVSEENRSRLSEAVETALRFRQRQSRLHPVASGVRLSAIPSHRLALRALRPRHHAAVAGALQLQSSARRLPDLPRLRAHHRARPAARDSRPRAQHRGRAW